MQLELVILKKTFWNTTVAPIGSAPGDGEYQHFILSPKTWINLPSKIGTFAPGRQRLKHVYNPPSCSIIACRIKCWDHAVCALLHIQLDPTLWRPQFIWFLQACCRESMLLAAQREDVIILVSHQLLQY
jgi:hypothetical protein